MRKEKSETHHLQCTNALLLWIHFAEMQPAQRPTFETVPFLASCFCTLETVATHLPQVLERKDNAKEIWFFVD